MKSIYLIILLAFTKSYAQERIYLKACSDQHSAIELARFAQSLASPIDQVDADPTQNCIDIFTASAKEDLFRRGLRLKFGNIQIDSVDGAPSVISGENQCQLQFVSEGSQNANSINGSIHIGHKVTGQIYSNQSSSSGQQSAMLLAGPVRSSISFDQHSFAATCKKVNAGAEIELDITGPSLNLKNSIFLSSNSKQFLGEITKQNNGQNNQIGTQNIGGMNQGQNEVRKIYLQLR
jgi:hypothetical protein